MDNEKLKLMRLWGMIRWFLVIVLFSIGLLHISFKETIAQNVVFFGIFAGIIALNLMFQMQDQRSKQWAVVFQIVLDILFATMIVHITGGLNSFFVWSYLIGIITASLTTPQSGGVIAGLMGSFALLVLILLYQNGILHPTDSAQMDISGSTVYLLSYTGLFSGIALIANYLSDRLSAQKEQSQKLLEEVTNLRTSAETEKELEALRPVLKEIAHLDHDINTPLCVITLSLGRVKRFAKELQNEGLQKSNNEITEAVNKISLLLQRIQPLKVHPLVQYKTPEDSHTRVSTPASNVEIASVKTPYTTAQMQDTQDREGGEA
ncbi:MAG: histidine kinase [Candidatus Cloacimonetes bacterium]|nr:histidine kinase [Candidatus Cloacimonadota bacterium]